MHANHEKRDKSLLGGGVLLIYSIEQMSQQFPARGIPVYCSWIGNEESIECSIEVYSSGVAKSDINLKQDSHHEYCF